MNKPKPLTKEDVEKWAIVNHNDNEITKKAWLVRSKRISKNVRFAVEWFKKYKDSPALLLENYPKTYDGWCKSKGNNTYDEYILNKAFEGVMDDNET